MSKLIVDTFYLNIIIVLKPESCQNIPRLTNIEFYLYPIHDLYGSGLVYFTILILPTIPTRVGTRHYIV